MLKQTYIIYKSSQKTTEVQNGRLLQCRLTGIPRREHVTPKSVIHIIKTQARLVVLHVKAYHSLTPQIQVLNARVLPNRGITPNYRLRSGRVMSQRSNAGLEDYIRIFTQELRNTKVYKCFSSTKQLSF